MLKGIMNWFSGGIKKQPMLNRDNSRSLRVTVLTGAPQFQTDSWMNFFTGLGVPGRDKNTATCFRSCLRVYSWKELDDLYRSDGLTKRIIDLIASEMLRQGWEVDGDPDGLILSQLEEMNVYAKLTSLIQWSRLYGGALIVMGIVDGRSLDQPVNVENIQAIDWMHVFDRWQCQIMCDYINVDLNDENYGYPDYYMINDYRTGTNFLVHHSRVLRMDWSILPPRERFYNQGWGDSVIASIYEELKNYGTAFGNTAVIMQDFVNGVLNIPGLSNDMAGSCGEAETMLRRRLDFANLAKGTTGMFVLDGEETYQKLSTNVAGLADLIDRFMLSLSSVTGIPVTLLFGRAPAGLNATGDADIRNFYDSVKQFQELKLKPVLEKLTYYFMKDKSGPWKGKEPKNWSIQFTPLWQNTEEQEAQVKRTTAETDCMYIDRGVLTADEVAISRFGGDRFSTNTLIDTKLRENGYDPDEVQDLQRQKETEIKDEPPEPTTGPDNSGNSNGENIIVVR